MPRTDYREIERSLVENAIEGMDLSIVDSYSGRGMHSRECFGLRCDTEEFVAFMIELATIDVNLARNLNSAHHTDSLGKGTIHYFPGYTFNVHD